MIKLCFQISKDDTLIFSPDIKIQFQGLSQADLTLKESECNFLKVHIQYLGHLILGQGI